MRDIREELIEKALLCQIAITNEQAAFFQEYMGLLLEWNEKINLTSITDPSAIIEKHFIDSLLLLKAVEIPYGGKLIDVGTGAGFPGIPIKIMRPDIRVTLLDGLNKRLVFLKRTCEDLRLEVELIHKRAEEAAREKALRESFDFATARAVAPLNILSEYCIPFIKVGGIFAAMKGPLANEEICESKNAWEQLGGRVQKIQIFRLPGGEERKIILIEKINGTPATYPRHGGTIKKKPL